MPIQITDDEIELTLRGAPEWITVQRMRHTLVAFQPHYKERLTATDALEILINMGNLFRLLSEDPKKAK